MSMFAAFFRFHFNADRRVCQSANQDTGMEGPIHTIGDTVNEMLKPEAWPFGKGRASDGAFCLW